MLAIFFMYYNACGAQQALRVTPAMEAGIADRIRSTAELVRLAELTVDSRWQRQASRR